MDTTDWLLIVYKAPPDPARLRIGVWRRLKGMGAVYLQSGVCVLPRSDAHLRALKLIENELTEGGGEALLLHVGPLDRLQGERLVARFGVDRDEQYRELIDKCADFEREVAKEVEAKHFTFAELEENEVDLKKLKVWLGRITALDLFGAPLAAQAAQRVVACEATLDAYARLVFDAQDENR